MTYLLSSLALLAGPLLSALAARYPASREGLKGFVLVTITGIVCLHIVPDAWHLAGFLSVVMGSLGLAFPLLLETVFRRALQKAHLAVLIIAAAGIVLHAVMDGMALLPVMAGEHAHGNELALGVIIHRLPVGIAIWWVLRPQFGASLALVTFALIIGATGAGYYLGAGVFADSAVWLALFQSFVAGSLIHVALFGVSHDHDHDHDREPIRGPRGGVRRPRESTDKVASRAYRLGLILGLVTIFLLPHVSGWMVFD